MMTRLPLLCRLLPTRRTALLCMLALVLLPSPGVAADADLQGILPDYIPNGLTRGDFAQLQNHWADWAEQTSRLVGDFYTSNDEQIRGSAATLEKLKVKIGTMEQALGDPQYGSIYGPLADLHGRLSRRVAVSEALLTSFDQNDDPELRVIAAELLTAIEDYEAEPTTEYMEAVRHSFDDMRRADPDSPLIEAMQRHYLNYNLRVVMDESLLQELLRDTRMESGYINEMVAGAQVTGCRWTNTAVEVDLKPSDDGVRFELILNGTIRTSAQGQTRLATIYTTGRHYFTSRKMVHFDGDRFEHWCATIGAGGQNCPYAARTCLSWAPLVGGASERLAVRMADNKSPEANAYALSKIRRDVSAQFNRETGNMLNRAELGLQTNVAGPLRQGGYYPDIKAFRSSETDLQMRSRTMEVGELGGGDILPLPVIPTDGVLGQVHESLLNQIGARLQLDGKRFTPQQLQDYLTGQLETIIGRPVDLSQMAGGAPSDDQSPRIEEIIFHEVDAARFQIRGGEVVLILSIGLKLEGRNEISPQRISVPLRFTLAGDKIRMERGSVGVSPIGRVPPRQRAQQITRSGIMRSKIQEAFESREFDAAFTIDVGEKQVALKTTDLRARGGWLSVIVSGGISQTDEPVPETPQQTAESKAVTR